MPLAVESVTETWITEAADLPSYPDDSTHHVQGYNQYWLSIILLTHYLRLCKERFHSNSKLKWQERRPRLFAY